MKTRLAIKNIEQGVFDRINEMFRKVSYDGYGTIPHHKCEVIDLGYSRTVRERAMVRVTNDKRANRQFVPCKLERRYKMRGIVEGPAVHIRSIYTDGPIAVPID